MFFLILLTYQFQKLNFILCTTWIALPTLPLNKISFRMFHTTSYYVLIVFSFYKQNCIITREYKGTPTHYTGEGSEILVKTSPIQNLKGKRHGEERVPPKWTYPKNYKLESKYSNFINCVHQIFSIYNVVLTLWNKNNQLQN